METIFQLFIGFLKALLIIVAEEAISSSGVLMSIALIIFLYLLIGCRKWYWDAEILDHIIKSLNYLYNLLFRINKKNKDKQD